VLLAHQLKRRPNRETEILDVAPIDLLHVVSKEFIARFSDELVSPEMKAQGLDIEFHWVNQTKKPGMLTGALQIQPTVRFSRLGSTLGQFWTLSASSKSELLNALVVETDVCCYTCPSADFIFLSPVG
jgi:hypothetical protein